MSSKADFTDEEWTAITDAPLEVMVTMFAAGQHGPGHHGQRGADRGSP